MNLAVRVGLLVVVLLITAVTIAVVGLTQLNSLDALFSSLIDTRAKEMSLAAEARVELLAALRAEKNAVLIEDKARAVEFAEVASKHIARLNELRSDLRTIVGDSAATAAGKAMSDFDRGIEDFTLNNKEVMRLATIKSNVEARGILINEMYGRVRDAEEFVAGLGIPNSDEPVATTSSAVDGRTRLAAMRGRQMVGQLYDLLFHLALHIAAIEERDMLRLDAEIRQRQQALQEAVHQFSGGLSDAERSRGSAVLASLETLRLPAARIAELSHIGSDLYAKALTTTKSLEVGDRCDSALRALLKSTTDSMDAERKSVSHDAQQARLIVITSTLAGTIVSLVLAFLIIRSITRPVAHGVKVFEAIAGGDLTQRMGFDRHDEIGRLGAASDQMAATLCEVVTQIRSQADNLSVSAGELSNVSHDLLAQSHEMATQTETVAAGTEQLSVNISGMAAAAEQMSMNVTSIASASEEVSVNVGTISASADVASRSVASVTESIGRITAALHEVARDARQGSEMTHEARERAAAANQAMRQLDQAANEINKVTEVIKSIALQTNLLALNATIEATSAGEAGKGFAVVAGEIKELASQSGESAEEIARKIESVQASTRDAVKVIEEVVRSIGEINTSAGRISEAVGAQTQTATQIAGEVAQARKGVDDIARSIAEVAKGANDASRNITEAAQAATDVSRNAVEAARASQTISSNIQGVSEATRQNNASAVKVDGAARSLKGIAEHLQDSVEHFKTGTARSSTGHA